MADSVALAAPGSAARGASHLNERTSLWRTAEDPLRRRRRPQLPTAVRVRFFYLQRAAFKQAAFKRAAALTVINGLVPGIRISNQDNFISEKEPVDKFKSEP